jgi:hypothetical protein
MWDSFELRAIANLQLVDVNTCRLRPDVPLPLDLPLGKERHKLSTELAPSCFSHLASRKSIVDWSETIIR